ncbi:hypothetical protein GPECTOR_9g529 [Gonium pectorale]|uniref:Cytochrome P450 n=1 Tax=Gonium pectorale TaxID=33097 RepID=A0A150GRL7_GONPE|nr:hypothetical protein GPECTOR_9g529 [Gonium pectorale]|eukprot:KXZ52485.1 hypothetical protein GPECTOR_9g529 [Gonium pectorale]
MEIVGRKYVVVADPALIPPIVGRGSPGLPKSDGYAMWDRAISPHPGVQGLFTVAENTPTWRAVRRSYGPALGPGTLGFHYPIALSCAAKLGDWLAAAGTHGSTPLELNGAAKALTLDMLGLSAFGLDFGCLDDPRGAQLPHLIEAAMFECGERARSVGRRLLPWLYEGQRRKGEEAMNAFYALIEVGAQPGASKFWWGRGKGRGQLARKGKEGGALIEDIWAGMKARGPPADGDTTMSAQLLRLADPARGSEALSDAQICAEIATIIIAGYETTANTLTWMCFALHAYPGAADRLIEELRAAGLAPPEGAEPTASTAGADPVTAAFQSLPGGYDAIASLPYLDAFVRECLRLYSTAPNGLIKAVPAAGPPARIGPYEVDPGVVVWIPFWSLHMSERNWERPQEFDPERWIGADPRSAGPVSASRCPVSAAVGALRAAAAAAGGNGASADASAGAAAATAVVERPPPPTAAAGRGGAASGSDSDGDGEAGRARSANGSVSVGGAANRAIRYMPFGDGARNCVGQHLAMLQLKVVVAYLASRFQFRLDDAAMGGVEGALERQRVNLTLEVEGGMWMYLQPR